MRLFMKGLSIWMNRLNKDIPSKMRMSVMLSVSVTGKQKRRGRGKYLSRTSLLPKDTRSPTRRRLDSELQSLTFLDLISRQHAMRLLGFHKHMSPWGGEPLCYSSTYPPSSTSFSFSLFVSFWFCFFEESQLLYPFGMKEFQLLWISSTDNAPHFMSCRKLNKLWRSLILEIDLAFLVNSWEFNRNSAACLP